MESSLRELFIDMVGILQYYLQYLPNYALRLFLVHTQNIETSEGLPKTGVDFYCAYTCG